MPEQFSFHGKIFSASGCYVPSDDSYLLAESIKEARGTCVDVGCGSGIQTLNLLFGGAQKVIAVDISRSALQTTQKNCEAARFGKKIETRNSDLFQNVPEKADVIVFNPPYVPSAKLEERDLDGGKKGREVLDKFLAQFPEHLNADGVCYFLQTDINGYEKTISTLKKKGISAQIIARKKLFFEELAVFKAQKSP